MGDRAVKAAEAALPSQRERWAEVLFWFPVTSAPYRKLWAGGRNAWGEEGAGDTVSASRSWGK